MVEQANEHSKLRQDIIRDKSALYLKKEEERLAARKIIDENEKEKQHRLI